MLKEADAARLPGRDATLFSVCPVMPRALHPDTPDAELARLNRSGANTLLTTELVEFCESGISIVVAVTDQTGLPIAGTACGCRVLEDGCVRLVLLRAANLELLDAASASAPIAATFSRPRTHRSIQLKGINTRLAEPTADERQAGVDQMAGLGEELRDVDYTARFTAAFCAVDPDDLVAIDFDPTSAFVQTPGPGAGAELKA